MFAKVFERIYDSSIAEDYNCRRMFMDLLVLADQTGAVDMTVEAIARRTNVPLEQVRRYVNELCQPDVNSRSQLEEGKRLVPLDSARDWGWQIVNYGHYRSIRDQEVRRSYFRDYQRKRRRKLKNVKYKKVNVVNTVENAASASASAYEIGGELREGVRAKFVEWTKVRRDMGHAPKDWDKMFRAQVRWLKKFSETDQLEVLDQSIRNNWRGLFEPKNQRPKPPARPPDPREERRERERKEMEDRLYGEER